MMKMLWQDFWKKRGKMTEIEISIALVVGGLIVLAFIFRAYFVPWWSVKIEKHTDSYKSVMKFIQENKELREHLGELFEVNSIPHNEGNVSVLIYKFEIIGEKGTGVLTVKMASKFAWYIYRVILEYNGNDFVVFREKE